MFLILDCVQESFILSNDILFYWIKIQFIYICHSYNYIEKWKSTFNLGILCFMWATFTVLDWIMVVFTSCQIDVTMSIQRDSLADRRNWKTRSGAILFCLHLVPLRLVSIFLYVGGVQNFLWAHADIIFFDFPVKLLYC